MDFKEQAYKDDTLAKEDWDQRKSSDQFRGAEEGMHVKTLLEFRAEGDLADMLTNPDRLSEFIHPGDNAVMVLNRIQASFANGHDDIIGPIKSFLPWNSIGMFVYDND